MDIITTEQLQELITNRCEWSISLFMPTHRAGREMEQDPIRLKNLLSEAEKRLLAKDLSSQDVTTILKEPVSLLQNSTFWQHQSDGLAIFFTKDVFHLFRLPVSLPEMLVVTDRFHIKPLLPLLTSDGNFHILALSQNKIRLLEGTQHTVDEIELSDTPETLSDSLPDGWPRKKLQIHIGSPSGGGNLSAKTQGHDTGSDTKQRLQKWFRTIDKSVIDLLDFIATQALTKGATVFAVSPEKIPGKALVAAVFRY